MSISETTIGLLGIQLKMASELHDALAQGLKDAPGTFKDLNRKASAVSGKIKEISNHPLYGKSAALCTALAQFDQANGLTAKLDAFEAAYKAFAAWAGTNTVRPINENAVKALEAGLEDLRSWAGRHGSEPLTYRLSSSGKYSSSNLATDLNSKLSKLESNSTIKDIGRSRPELVAQWNEGIKDMRQVIRGLNHGPVPSYSSYRYRHNPNGIEPTDALMAQTDILNKMAASLDAVKSTQGSSDPLDTSKASAADYIGYLDTSDTVKRSFPMTDPAALDAIKRLEPPLLSSLMAAALAPQLEAAMKETDDRLRALAATADNADKRRRLEALKKGIITLRGSLVTMLNDKGPMAQAAAYQEFARAQTGVLDMLGDFKSVKVEGVAWSPFGSSGSSGSSAVDAAAGVGSNPFAMGLMRFPDLSRMKSCVRSLEALKKASEGHKAGQRVASMGTLTLERITSVAGNKAADPDTPDGRAVVSKVIAATYGYVATVRRSVASFLAMHSEYALRTNRDAIVYMAYWTRMKDAGTNMLKDDEKNKSEFTTLIKAWEDHAKELTGELASSKLKGIRSNLGDVGSAAERALGGAESEPWRKLEVEFEKANFQAVSAQDKIVRMFSNEYGSPADVVLDVQFLLIYALKALRLLCAWASLRVASNVFQKMYRRQVYNELKDPPHTALFVALFVGTDLALNVVVLAFLGMTKFLFGNDADSGYPIDGQFLVKWGVDVAMSTTIVAVIALVIGSVIMNKKAFNFRYSGDRAIRAMQSMVLYVYAVILLVPFFRLVG